MTNEAAATLLWLQTQKKRHRKFPIERILTPIYRITDNYMTQNDVPVYIVKCLMSIDFTYIHGMFRLIDSFLSALEKFIRQSVDDESGSKRKLK